MLTPQPPIPTRRAVLGAGLVAGLALPLASAAPVLPRPAGRAKRLLILGGTRFLGPEVVRAALARGWEVTLFNRGKSNPEMFAELEQLRGDRDTGDLSALEGREWDAVVDTSGYVPGHVRAAAEMVKAGNPLYVFVSTVSVYEDQSSIGVTEDSAVMTVGDEVIEEVKTIRQSFAHYGAMKALCEQAAEEVLPGRVANVRPGLIVGPGDESDRFTWWPVRVARGGEVLAPGNPDMQAQYIDVRDLGDWIGLILDQGTTGVYNAVGFPTPQTMAECLYGCKIVLGADATFTWVSEEFLIEHEVRAYMEMPLWLPKGYDGTVDIQAAVAAGLTFRPPGDTIRDTAAWAATRPEDHRWRAGMSEEREAELLDAWRAR